MKKSHSIIITVVVGIILFVVGIYLISPLFIDDVVMEENVFADNTSFLLMSGVFRDADSFHKVSGTVTLSQSTKFRNLRFENLDATNGPDLKVYLATDETASDYLSLGDLKGNIGNQNYNISDDVNLTTYDTVLIWCEQFGVLFGSADLS